MADSEGESDVPMGEVQFDRETSSESIDRNAHREQSNTSSTGDGVPVADAVFVFQGIPVTGSNIDKIRKHGLAVVVPPATRRWEYQVYEEPAVQEVLEEYDEDEDVSYLVRYIDGSEAIVSEKLSFDSELSLLHIFHLIAQHNSFHLRNRSVREILVIDYPLLLI